jgi:flavodoxin
MALLLAFDCRINTLADSGFFSSGNEPCQQLGPNFQFRRDNNATAAQSRGEFLNSVDSNQVKFRSVNDRANLSSPNRSAAFDRDQGGVSCIAQDLGMTKVLTVYYSRSGFTRKVAKAIEKNTGCALEEILEAKRREGIIGYLGAGLDAILDRQAELAPAKQAPAGYGIIVIGCPVWASKVPPAVRAYVRAHAAEIKNVALFCTMGGNGGQAVINELASLCGRAPISSLVLTDAQISDGSFLDKLKKFTDELHVPA